VPILSIGRLLQLHGLRICQQVNQFWILKCLESLGRPIDDEYWLGSPLNDNLLSRAHLTDIKIDRTPGRQNRGVGVHLINQWP
jgi:hypothetical protein